MADRRTVLSAMAGLTKGARDASSNLLNIMVAGHKLKQEDELLRLKKKVVEKDLDMAPLEKEIALNKIEQSKAYIGYYSAAQKQKQEAAGTIKKKYESGLNFMNQILANTDLAKELNWSYNTGTGSMTVGNQRTTGAKSMEERYKNYVDSHLKAQAGLPERYRKQPIKLEEYNKMFESGMGNLNDSTQKAISALEDYGTEDDALAGLEANKQYMEDIDQDALLNAWEEKWGSSDKVRSILGE